MARLAEELRASYESVVVGYADCGTYGALDEVCERLGLRRLEGLHCYDVYAGASRIEAFFADQPGTYLLTDFLVKSFARTVETELGLDRWPELRDEYFRHYTRVVWLAQERDPRAAGLAADAAAPARPPADRRADRQRGPRARAGGARRCGAGFPGRPVIPAAGRQNFARPPQSFRRTSGETDGPPQLSP